MGFRPTMEQAVELLRKYNKSEALIRHAFHVSCVMGHFSEIFGEDKEKWEIIGLLHDIDYEMYPNEHCVKASEIMKEAGYDDDWIHSVVCHAYGLSSEVAPESYMEKLLYTIDELTGLVYATSLMRPSKSTLDLESKSVLKKYKNPNFAAGVNRGVIENGLKLIDKELEYIIDETIKGMRKYES